MVPPDGSEATVIEKLRVVFCCVVAACTVKVKVPDEPPTVPVTSPVELLIDNPVGKDPELIE
jgi:hypothetical protein